ncbi:MAG: PAS domain S-box protein [Proteobacteria bacterium]|nr:PAS domain S-box protein [Desulfobulbaceae bacterium]MBU4151303.1 PAS domain S-box protein [Pseudomonadota bacterium]
MTDQGTNPRQDLGIQKGSLLALILCFAGLSAYLFFDFYDSAKTTAIRQLNDQQQIHAKQAAQGIADFFKTWTGILTSFSKMDEIISVDDNGKRYMALFYEAHQDQIKSITRVDEKGVILYTVPFSGAEGSDISNQRHVREILRNHQPVVSDVFKTVQGFDAVALHVPVFKGATFKGTVAIVIDFTNLATRYLEVIQIGKTGYAWVISHDGTTLYSPVPGFTGNSIFDNCKECPEILAMVKEMLQGHQGTATYLFDKIGATTVKPVKKYAVYLPVAIGNSFWSIVVASSEDEVLSALASFKNRLLLVIGMILIGGVLFTIICTKAWMIVAAEKTRKKAEEKLRESEQYNRLLFELSPIGLALCRRNGSLVDINPAYAKIIGRSVEETLKLTYWDITPPKYLELEHAQLKNIEKTGRYGPYEKEYTHKDGRLIPVRLQGLFIEKKGEKFIWSSVEDVSESKKAERDLLRNEKVLRLFVEHSPAAIAMFDNEMKYIFASSRFLEDYNLGQQNVTGRSHYEVFPDIPERWRAIHKRCLAGAIEQCDDDPFPHKNGRVDWVRWEIRPWYETEGEIGGIILFSEVITKRKQAELELTKYRENLEELVDQRTEQVEKAQAALMNMVDDLQMSAEALEQANEQLKEIDRLKSIFIASMSHELRTPLNSVIGFSSVLSNEWAGPVSEEQKKLLLTINRAGKHLLSLINDVIDISKIESGKLDTSREDFDLFNVVIEAVENLAKDLADKKLSITTEIPHLAMHSDRRRLLQCILNLLSNAVKFTTKGGVQLMARTVKEGEHIEITVTDTGIGIKEEDMPKLFQSFVRFDSPLRASVPGTGLGLYLTKKLVRETLGGEISAKSTHGAGSCFTLNIPAILNNAQKGVTTT